jgi:hypothetical protein
MSRHLADRARSVTGASLVKIFADVERRLDGREPAPAVKALQRKRRAASLSRPLQFLRIARGREV